MLAPRIVNDVSCVTRINHGIHFAWQAQYLLRLEVDFAWSAYDVSYEARINHEIHFAWQAQDLLRFEVGFACSAHSK